MTDQLNKALEALRRCASAVGATLSEHCSFQFHMYVPEEIEAAFKDLLALRAWHKLFVIWDAEARKRMKAEKWGDERQPSLMSCLERIDELNRANTQQLDRRLRIIHQAFNRAAGQGVDEEELAKLIACELSQWPPSAIEVPVDYAALTDLAFQLYCKETAGGLDVRDRWSQLNYPAKRHYIEKVLRGARP